MFTQLRSGDNVRVTMRTGEKTTFTLAEVQPEGLVAKDGRHIAFREIGQLERQRLSKRKSWGLALGICAATFVAFILILSHAPIPVA